jgi:stage V sporulation protein SpoVS
MSNSLEEENKNKETTEAEFQNSDAAIKNDIKDDSIIEYRVAAKTPVPQLASAISKCFLEARLAKKKFIVRALGQEPINQALKGIIRATSMLAQNGHYIAIKPFWIDDIEKEKAGNLNVMGFKIIETN